MIAIIHRTVKYIVVQYADFIKLHVIKPPEMSGKNALTLCYTFVEEFYTFQFVNDGVIYSYHKHNIQQTCYQTHMIFHQSNEGRGTKLWQ